jgi:hypothetical protein
MLVAYLLSLLRRKSMYVSYAKSRQLVLLLLRYVFEYSE